LVGERTRIVNRIKSTLARLGIRNFKPSLRKAAEHLATVRSPQGMPLPPNTLAELQRDMARLGFVVSQIREIEEARQNRLEQQHDTGPTPWFGCWLESSVLVSRRLICWSMRCCHGQCVTAEQWRVEPVLGPAKGPDPGAGLTGSPDESGARRREQGNRSARSACR
jgi:transposase